MQSSLEAYYKPPRGWTAAEMAQAGPLYNPSHPKCKQAMYAVEVYRLAVEVFQKHDELNHNLIVAKQEMAKASSSLRGVRANIHYQLKKGYIRAQLAHEYYVIRQRELAVIAAHDKVWAAQRAIELHLFTYGPTTGATS